MFICQHGGRSTTTNFTRTCVRADERRSQMISEVESRRVILQLANEHVLTSVSEFKSRWVILQLAREHVQTLKSEFKLSLIHI